MYKKIFKHKLISCLLVSAIAISSFVLTDSVSAASIKVKRGDTISLIAKKYNISRAELLKKITSKMLTKSALVKFLFYLQKTTPQKAVVKKQPQKK